jgi:hypothetical protein
MRDDDDWRERKWAPLNNGRDDAGGVETNGSPELTKDSRASE